MPVYLPPRRLRNQSDDGADKYSQAALLTYAKAAEEDGRHAYASDIRELATRVGEDSPWCKSPE